MKTEPAFPFTDADGTVWPGMTLRDYFANSASDFDIANYSKEIIQKLMGVDDIPTGIDGIMFWYSVESKLQYMKADAMLIEREKPCQIQP